MQSKLLIPFILLFTIFIAACSQQAQQTQEKSFGDSVQIDNFEFSPSILYASKGATITWTNNEGVSHQILFKNIDIEGEVLQKGDTFSFKFDNQGEYNYICKIHPSMNGKIIVE